jgi:hypothetical protein
MHAGRLLRLQLGDAPCSSGLLVRDAVSLGYCFSTFQKNAVPSFLKTQALLSFETSVTSNPVTAPHTGRPESPDRRTNLTLNTFPHKVQDTAFPLSSQHTTMTDSISQSFQSSSQSLVDGRPVSVSEHLNTSMHMTVQLCAWVFV